MKYSSNSRMIKIYGLAENYPSNSRTFKQFEIQELIKIPDNYPEIKKLISVNSTIVIQSKRIITSSKGVSNEGKELTGPKLIFEGYVNQKIEYLENNSSNVLYLYNLKIPFCNYVVLDTICQFENYEYDLSAFLEDIYVRQLSSRKISQNISVLVNAFKSFNV